MDSSKQEHSSFTTIYPMGKVDATPLMPASVDVIVETSADVVVPVPVPVPAPPPSETAEVRVIRGYRLLQKLGDGAFGVVYKALSSGGVEVAIKEIRFPLDQPQSKRELDAMELIKGLRHPYLLALHDFWVEADRLYIAMELADCTLLELAAQRRPAGIPQPELLRIFEEAAELLDFLHEKCVLHRDIKPANILLLRGHTKVADLGLAKIATGNVAYSMTVAGTPVYMAPETFGNEFRPESDQYALALCFAEMRLGRRICDANHMAGVITWHLQETPKLEGLQPHEEEAVRRALSKNPTERFPSCQDFVRALHAPQAPVAPLTPTAPKSWKNSLALAVFLSLPVVALLIVLGWRLLLPAAPDATQLPSITKTLLEWTPTQHDFDAPSNAQIVSVDGKQYYDRIEKDVGDDKVVFLLIPQLHSDDPRTFYIMENKVSNRLYRTAADHPGFQRMLDEWKRKCPFLKWDEWKQGGNRNGMAIGSASDDLPVLRVNVLEAYCFARWIGGKLPTEMQWDAAAGKGPGVKAPYREPDSKLQPGDVAVGRLAEGPMPLGTSKRDISPRGCLDMAGNGAEWTRNLADGGVIPPSDLSTDALQTLWVAVRGRSYSRNNPFRFSDERDTREFRFDYSDVGFRVVVEP
jgi:serine/threonine protein kinase